LYLGNRIDGHVGDRCCSNSAIPQYLTDLPATGLFASAPFNAGFNGGWKVIDFAKMRSTINYDYYINGINPGNDPSNYMNTYSPRRLSEDTWAQYVMADGRQDVFGKQLRYNVGMRYVRTIQKVAGIVNDFWLEAVRGRRPARAATPNIFCRAPISSITLIATCWCVVQRREPSRAPIRPIWHPVSGSAWMVTFSPRGTPVCVPSRPTILMQASSGIRARVRS
jgi:hypothetical protein